jgi:hypothetical protein
MKLADQRRMERLRHVGCVACLISTGRPNYNVDVHHLNEHGRAGQKRRGDAFTIPLCAWHHRGLPPNGKDSKWATEFMGPSLAKSSKAFRARYGTDDELLAMTNERLTNLDHL